MSEYQGSSSYFEGPDIQESYNTPALPEQVAELGELSGAIRNYATGNTPLDKRRIFMVTADPSDLYVDIAPVSANTGYHNITTRLGYDLEGNTTILWRQMADGRTYRTLGKRVRHLTLLTLGDGPEAASRPTQRTFEEDGFYTKEGDFEPVHLIEKPAHRKEHSELTAGVAKGILNYLRRVVEDLPAEVRVSVPYRDEHSRLLAIDPLAATVTAESLAAPAMPLRGSAPRSEAESAPVDEERSARTASLLRYLSALLRFRRGN